MHVCTEQDNDSDQESHCRNTLAVRVITVNADFCVISIIKYLDPNTKWEFFPLPEMDLHTVKNQSVHKSALQQLKKLFTVKT